MNDAILIDTLRDPARAGGYSPAEWDLLVRQARSANLMAHLAVLLGQVKAQIPEAVGPHLRSAALVVKRQNCSIRWEISQLQQALYDLAVPIVLLKGAAYVQAGLANGRQRLFNDIDILVPRSALEEVEKKLRQHGWRTTHNNAYDQRYYRRWMHELPPLQHQQRRTVLDIHHAILPLTARLHPDPRKMIEDAVADPDNEDIYWLSPEDMVLHSMTHLFHDGELENGLRDLVDMQQLLSEFGKRDEFWGRLCRRAVELELSRPLCYGLRYVKMVLQTPVPDDVIRTISRLAPGGFLESLMDGLFLQGLRPSHASCGSYATSMARWMLYVRSHYLRMPLRLLVPHLVHQAVTKDDNTDIPLKIKKIFDDIEKKSA